MKLLGIHWGQFPEEWRLSERIEDAAKESALKRNETFVEGLSGMTCVIPAKDILATLSLPSLVKHREAIEAKFASSNP